MHSGACTQVHSGALGCIRTFGLVERVEVRLENGLVTHYGACSNSRVAH